MAFVALLGASCRFGGPEGSPTRLIEVDAGPPVAEDDDASVDVEQPPDAREPAPASGQSAPAAAAPPQASSASCQAPADLECEPVSGEGCLPFTQCIVDASSSEPAAACVFSDILLDDTCEQDELSTNCPPQYTCVMGECRKYCYCDTDCDDGAACADPSGEGGSGAFKLCARAVP